MGIASSYLIRQTSPSRAEHAQCRHPTTHSWRNQISVLGTKYLLRSNGSASQDARAIRHTQAAACVHLWPRRSGTAGEPSPPPSSSALRATEAQDAPGEGEPAGFMVWFPSRDAALARPNGKWAGLASSPAAVCARPPVSDESGRAVWRRPMSVARYIAPVLNRPVAAWAYLSTRKTAGTHSRLANPNYTRDETRWWRRLCPPVTIPAGAQSGRVRAAASWQCAPGRR